MYSERNARGPATPIDLVTFSIGRLSDDEIWEMRREDLVEILRLSKREPPYPDMDPFCINTKRLKSIAMDVRDRCRRTLTLAYA